MLFILFRNEEGSSVGQIQGVVIAESVEDAGKKIGLAQVGASDIRGGFWQAANFRHRYGEPDIVYYRLQGVEEISSEIW